MSEQAELSHEDRQLKICRYCQTTFLAKDFASQKIHLLRFHPEKVDKPATYIRYDMDLWGHFQNTTIPVCRGTVHKGGIEGVFETVEDGIRYRQFLESCKHGQTHQERGCDGVSVWDKKVCDLCGLLLESKGEVVWNA